MRRSDAIFCLGRMTLRRYSSDLFRDIERDAHELIAKDASVDDLNKVYLENLKEEWQGGRGFG